MDGQELLRLSIECYKSLRSKYPFRGRWTPEFEAWQRFLEDQVGVGGLKYEMRFGMTGHHGKFRVKSSPIPPLNF